MKNVVPGTVQLFFHTTSRTVRYRNQHLSSSRDCIARSWSPFRFHLAEVGIRSSILRGVEPLLESVNPRVWYTILIVVMGCRTSLGATVWYYWLQRKVGQLRELIFIWLSMLYHENIVWYPEEVPRRLPGSYMRICWLLFIDLKEGTALGINPTMFPCCQQIRFRTSTLSPVHTKALI